MKVLRRHEAKYILDDGIHFIFLDTLKNETDKVKKPCKEWPEFEGFEQEFMAMNDEDFSSLVSEMLEK